MVFIRVSSQQKQYQSFNFVMKISKTFCHIQRFAMGFHNVTIGKVRQTGKLQCNEWWQYCLHWHQTCHCLQLSVLASHNCLFARDNRASIIFFLGPCNLRTLVREVDIRMKTEYLCTILWIERKWSGRKGRRWNEEQKYYEDLEMNRKLAQKLATSTCPIQNQLCHAILEAHK